MYAGIVLWIWVYVLLAGSPCIVLRGCYMAVSQHGGPGCMFDLSNVLCSMQHVCADAAMIRMRLCNKQLQWGLSGVVGSIFDVFNILFDALCDNSCKAAKVITL